MHDDVIQWKHFPRYLPFVREIQRSPVKSPHKGQWLGALIFSLICAWINGWVSNCEAGDLWRHRVHFDVIVMDMTWSPHGCTSQRIYECPWFKTCFVWDRITIIGHNCLHVSTAVTWLGLWHPNKGKRGKNFHYICIMCSYAIREIGTLGRLSINMSFIFIMGIYTHRKTEPCYTSRPNQHGCRWWPVPPFTNMDLL